jgi:DNA-directed RNA polymerase specialized sigma24 family protein
MDSTQPITQYLNRARAGDAEAGRALFGLLYERLLAVARRPLGKTNLPLVEPEDAVASAFESYCHDVTGERFAGAQNRDELMALLAVIVYRKALNLLKRQKGKTRCPAEEVSGGDAVNAVAARGEPTRLPRQSQQFLDGIADRELRDIDPSMLDAGCLDVLEGLAAEGDRLVEVVLWKLHGCTNAEIARKLGCALKSVERKLRRVRELWDREASDA